MLIFSQLYIMIMNLNRKVHIIFQHLYRHRSAIPRNLSVVKVLSSDEDDNVKLLFKYSQSSNLVVRAPKHDNVQNLLDRIKLIANLQHKKEEIRRAVMNKRLSTEEGTIQDIADVSVSLLLNGKQMHENTLNNEALSQATELRIGETVYDVKYNQPTVISLTLPPYILEGCSLRPKFRLECTNLEDCVFMWYRSQSKELVSTQINECNTDDIIIAEDKYWLKVHEGFIYTTCKEDIGCFLKIVCIPKCGDLIGDPYTIESTVCVEELPENIPFEERHKYTKIITDENSIRCISYNTLANSYVEKRKFPYCSVKTRDNYYRKQLLSRELKGYNGDILCLQEVEERAFTYDLAPVLKNLGYKGYYKKKGGRRYEGLATFFRSNKFNNVKYYEVLLNDIIKRDISSNLRTKLGGGNNKDISVLLNQDSAFQVVLLQDHKDPERKLLVANTHLYSNKDSPEVRLIQTAVCTNYIEYIIKKQKLNSVAVIFCGDFNSLPTSDAYNFVVSGACSPKWKNITASNADAILTHNLELGNACGTPTYTNYTEEFHGCLDYIFYSKNKLKVTEIVPMPPHEDVICQTALPNELFPSDHIALVCTLQWNHL